MQKTIEYLKNNIEKNKNCEVQKIWYKILILSQKFIQKRGVNGNF